MTNKPIFSIVTPTRGDFSEGWLRELLKVKGDVEFILVFPPGVLLREIADQRVKVLISPYKSEVMQRAVGLLNVSGEYILALDDDDFVRPDIMDLVINYFRRFPDSWVLRLWKEGTDFRITKQIAEWIPISAIDQMEVCSKEKVGYTLFKNGEGLLEIPIAPLNNRFDMRFIFWPFTKRKDHHGIHMENSNDRIWKAELVKEAVIDILRTTKILGPLTWVPSLSLDRLLGLYIQAKYFKKGLVVGHWMPKPAQLYKNSVPNPDNHGRIYVSADALLLKRFPQYGYFWNLFFDQLWTIPQRAVAYLKRKLLSKKGL